jgi:hypothetical protein
VLRRLSLFDLNINDPVKGVTDVPTGGLEEVEEREPCENSVEESINGGDRSERPEMGDC